MSPLWAILVLVVVIAGFIRVWNDPTNFPLACYSAAFGWVALGVISRVLEVGPAPMDMTRTDALVIGLLLTLPIPATLIGLGRGSLSNHRWRGALIGFASAFLVQVAVLACFH